MFKYCESKTYNIFNDEWIDIKKYGNHMFMKMESPIDPYTENTVEKIEIALKENLNETYKKVIKSVDEGYLTIGYYEDDMVSETVGYIHSLSPLQLYCSFEQKNIPPNWFYLKAFY